MDKSRIIEVVIAAAFGDVNTSSYEAATKAQNIALKWLVSQLLATLQIKNSEIFRHPDISRKNVTEASTAQW